jgi:hypothetical protein
LLGQINGAHTNTSETQAAALDVGSAAMEDIPMNSHDDGAMDTSVPVNMETCEPEVKVGCGLKRSFASSTFGGSGCPAPVQKPFESLLKAVIDLQEASANLQYKAASVQRCTDALLNVLESDLDQSVRFLYAVLKETALLYVHFQGLIFFICRNASRVQSEL